MSRIRVLDPVVANQIAAGEVVERPASVIKELVENSLDAGASRIRVTVEQGGHLRMAVQDDGMGMDEEDLVLSVARHATSKLRQLSDLEQEQWLGFRGEALAAISAVSRLTVSSRTADRSIGHRLTVEHGRPGPLTPVSMPVGTTVVVESLFAELPARLKALKSPAADVAAIHHVVQNYAIGYPGVAFVCATEQRTLIDTPGRGDIPETILRVSGTEAHDNLIPVRYDSEGGVGLSGYILPAHITRGTRQWQSLYINGRWVANWTLRHAIEEAYRPQLPDRRYPGYWLWITLRPGEVDPNAHPTKSEVRLERERQVAALLYRAVTDALVARSASPGLLSVGDAKPPALSEQSQFGWERPPDASDSRPVLHREFAELTPLAQWQAKYIIAQGPAGLYLIDQHAAHERVYYEEFRRRGDEVVTVQPLLLPWTLSLTPGEWAVWLEHHEVLRTIGFEVADAGGTTLLVRGIPRGFADTLDPGIFREVLDSLADGPGHGHRVRWAADHRDAMAACKAAVKAYRALSFEEMSALLNQMARVEDPRGCPHGRPTLLRMSIEEVDRRFGRKG